MRLLFLNERVSYANATSYALDLASALLARGERVQLCTTGGDLEDAFRARGIETLIVKRNPFAFHKLLEFLREYDPDLLHVQNLRSVPFACRIAQRLERPFVITAHKRPAPDLSLPAHRLLCGVIAANELIREAMVNDFGLPKHTVRVIPRGIDLKRFAPGPEPPWTPASGRLPVVGTVGELTPTKGQQVLIEAARRVLDAGVEAHFAIVGEGKEEARLHKLARELGLLHHVTFSPHIPGPRQLYGIFDIVAMPVLKTGVGVTAIEAMAMRKPLVTSGVGEMLHLVQDGVTGLLVREGDAQGLADRIVELIRNPQEIARLGTEARRWVEKNFALEPMVEATREFYAECLTARAERVEAW